MFMQGIVRIYGTQVDLCIRRVSEEAKDYYLRWINDPDVSKYLGHNAVTTGYLAEDEFLKKIGNNSFNIVTKDGIFIGNCDLIEKKNRNFVIGIMIGDKSYWGKGIGTEVVKLLIKYAFEQCNAHKVSLSLDAKNVAALKCYTKAGMTQCGCNKAETWIDGEWVDMLRMEILDTEYFGKMAEGKASNEESVKADVEDGKDEANGDKRVKKGKDIFKGEQYRRYE